MVAELSPEGGFGSPEIVSSERAGWFTGSPTVAVSASGTWVAWSETDGVNSRVQARQKTRSGWEPIVTLSTPGATAEHPSVALDPWATLHAVWIEGGTESGNDGRGRAVVYTSLGPGAAAAPPRTLSVGGTGPFESPVVATDQSGRVVVAWVDRGAGNSDIVVRQGVAGFSALPTPERGPDR